MEEQIVIRKKGTSLIVTGVEEKPIKFPSQIYPLTGPPEIATFQNTAPFPDNERSVLIRQAFDSIQPEIGRCYTNTTRLILALNEVGVCDVQAYVGWVIVDGAQPIHHCFAVIGNSVLDFLERPSLIFNEWVVGAPDMEQMRIRVAKRVMDMQYIPNSQKATFGQADPNAVYIACPCRPDVGLKAFQRLMRAHPNHPSYTNIYADGTNKLQRILRTARGEA